MAFSGYLIKVGTYTVPLSFMRYDTYKVTKHGQDLGSYRDANGLLHRTALSHTVPKIEFNTPMMTLDDFQAVWTHITNSYVNSTEKSVNLTFFVPEINDYVTQKVYVPDIDFSIRNIDGNTINLNEMRIAFISY